MKVTKPLNSLKPLNTNIKNNKISYLKYNTGNLKTDTNDLLEITTDF